LLFWYRSGRAGRRAGENTDLLLGVVDVGPLDTAGTLLDAARRKGGQSVFEISSGYHAAVSVRTDTHLALAHALRRMAETEMNPVVSLGSNPPISSIDENFSSYNPSSDDLPSTTQLPL
jgi:hypothetical protein